MDTRGPAGRITYLDGLRAVAVAGVVVLHILAEPLRHVSNVAAAVASRGFLGVYIFFVISGFAIAHSVSRTPANAVTAVGFLIRRVCRLDPPYWVSMAVSVGIAVVAARLLHNAPAVTPSFRQVALHVLYLQGVFNGGAIQDVYWTLCFEIQFYLILIILLSIKEHLSVYISESSAFRAVFLPTLVLSLLFEREILVSPAGMSFRDWYAFFAGVAAHRFVTRRDLVTATLALLLPLAATHLSNAVTVALTGGTILVGSVAGKLDVWLSQRFVQYIGRISYSIYLFHLPVGGRSANLLVRILGPGPWTGLMSGLIGIAIAVAFSDVMWRLVERPSIRVSRSAWSWYRDRFMRSAAPSSVETVIPA